MEDTPPRIQVTGELLAFPFDDTDIEPSWTYRAWCEACHRYVSRRPRQDYAMHLWGVPGVAYTDAIDHGIEHLYDVHDIDIRMEHQK